jgi:peptidoglycan/xylan/chitin deacetylase (PgdA/CDA1 family)
MKRIRILAISVTFVVFLMHNVLAQQIALTIDDAPCFHSELYQATERSQLLLQHLNEANVSQVAFFVIGKCAASRRGLQRVRMYAEAGHLIANHSYHHWDFDNVKATKYTQDILKAERVIRDIPNFTKWYRSPMLHEGDTREKRDHLRAFLTQHGYINGYATIDNWEFYIDHLLQKGLKKGRQFNKENLRELYLDHMWNAVQFYDGVAQQFFSRPVKHTLLLHDFDITTMFIKDLVEFLREKGWTIISPEEAYTDTLLSTAPDVLLNNQGRVMAIAKSKGYPGPYRSGEDEQSIEEMFVKYRVWEN